MANKKIKTPIEISFTENESALKRFLERFLYNTHDVEDVLQDTFLESWKIERRQAIQLPKPYLFRVARNLALKELRKKSRQLEVYMAHLGNQAPESGNTVTDDKCDCNERLVLFQKALATLSPQCKKVFVLRKVFGFSQKEIARRMNIAESTVEKHISNGMQRCNVYMQAYGVEKLPAKKLPERLKGKVDKVNES